MPDSQTNSVAVGGNSKEAVRPVVLVDRRSLRDYAASLTHFLVALADTPHPAAFVYPPDVGTASVPCPAVEFIGYPMIRAPLFWRQNRMVLLERLEKFKPTVLHCFGSGKIHLTRYLSGQLDIPYVVTFNRTGRRLFKPLIRPSHCMALIASSKAIARYLAKAYPRYGLRIRHINLGTFVADRCACFARRNGIASVIVAQHLDRAAEFEPLLRAVRHLILDGYEFVFAIIGSGRAEGKIHEMIRSLGLAQIVSLVPDMQPLRSVFAGADVFIQPTCRAEFNSRLLEAMSVGMSVAASEDCLDDMLIEDQTAVFFGSRDELSIYDCLGMLLADRRLAKQIAAGGRKYLQRHHTVSRMTSALIQTYLSAQKKYKHAAPS
ncbi:MAG: hypothetical protein DRP66_11320 [Planctomycetota bacterium]|nr:MAG: hypothetical protein DRP66_11320 [Planctomycetota bacterium]